MSGTYRFVLVERKTCISVTRNDSMVAEDDFSLLFIAFILILYKKTLKLVSKASRRGSTGRSQNSPLKTHHGETDNKYEEPGAHKLKNRKGKIAPSEIHVENLRAIIQQHDRERV